MSSKKSKSKFGCIAIVLFIFIVAALINNLSEKENSAVKNEPSGEQGEAKKVTMKPVNDTPPSEKPKLEQQKKTLSNGDTVVFDDYSAVLNIGIVKLDGYGTPKSKTTQYGAMRWLLKNHSQDRLRVDYIEKFDSGTTFPRVVEYSRSSKVLIMTHKKTNVRNIWRGVEEDSFKNNVWGKGIKDEIDRSQKYISALGEKPSQSEFNASVPVVVDYVKNNATDKDSIKFLEWSKLSPLGKNWVVRAKFSGKNSLGATVTHNQWFYIQYGQVVGVK